MSRRLASTLLLLCCLLTVAWRGAGACAIDVKGLPPQPNDEESLYPFLSKLSEYAEECLPENIREGWWPNAGHIAHVAQQIATYRRLAANPAVKVICEVGFNAGHSSAVMLSAQPGTMLVSFDLQELPYSQRMPAVMKAVYGDRFFLISGRSNDAMPAFMLAGGHCDLVSVDGQHDRMVVTDVLNAIQMSREGAVVVADDTSSSFGEVLRAWDDLVAAGYLRNATCEEGPMVGRFDKRWCWGEVASRFGRLDNERVLPGWVPEATAAAAQAATRSSRFNESLQTVQQQQHHRVHVSVNSRHHDRIGGRRLAM